MNYEDYACIILKAFDKIDWNDDDMAIESVHDYLTNSMKIECTFEEVVVMAEAVRIEISRQTIRRLAEHRPTRKINSETAYRYVRLWRGRILNVLKFGFGTLGERYLENTNRIIIARIMRVGEDK